MNLFIISNMGQLYQAQALIKKENLRNNVMAILYTEMNTRIYDYLLGSLDDSLYSNIESLLLPKYPNKFTRKKLKKIRSIYEALFNKYDFTKVFICSFESHYNFFKDISIERNIEINLFEEGTATYKFLVDENIDDVNFTSRFSRAISISKNDFRKAFNPKKKGSFIYKYTIAIIKTTKRITASLFTKEQRLAIKSFFFPVELRSAFYSIKEFDQIFVAFPEKAKLIFKAKQYNELISDYSLNDETTRLIKENYTIRNLDEKSIVFINQRYNIKPDIHVHIICSFLAENFPNEKIFIKFHPKDTPKMKECFAEGIGRYELNTEIIDLDIEVPFEAILKIKKPKMVIGISSTSLIYTEKILPSTETLSCANYYINLLNNNGINRKVIDLIAYHKRILETLSGITVK